MNILNRDLNLLFIFHILYQEKNASRVAERLMMSQPALSHKLNKLRQEWRDPLFVRGPRGLIPTPKAHELAGEVSALVTTIEQFFSEKDTHDFQEHTDRIYIHTTDFIEKILLNPLLAALETIAPNISIVMQNTLGKLPRDLLENGQCDLAIAGFYSNLPNTFRQQKLLEEHFVVVASKQNSKINKLLDLDTYLRCGHVVTTLNGDLYGPIDVELERHGRQRNVRAGISSFLAATHAIHNSDRLITCLSSIAADAVSQDPSLVIYPLPVSVHPIEIMQIWHERTHEDPLRKMIRNQIKQILSDI